MPKPSRIISIDPSGKIQSIDDADVRDARKRLNWLAWLLDSSIPVPGTRLTVGVDVLIGFFPFLGDLLGVLLSSYILSEAARLGAPKIVLMRMAFNIGVEGLLGTIPLLGDAFDAAWKANQRNVRLLDAWLDRPTKAERSSRLLGVCLVIAVAAFMISLGAAMFFLLRWLIGLLS
ncbi:MAG TPA: DUF4112 domain-containing protein [Burkholderiales bacterium]|nr:DUF4112 domain-containing protein [Burkholderiales bacterium]